MKTILALLAAVTLAIGPCYAQRMGGGGKHGHGRQREDPEKQKLEAAKRKAAEDAYKTGLSQVPDANQKPDPWKNVR
jgi:hypothetical protein